MKAFVIAALALVAAADQPQTRYAPAPAYRPRPTYAQAPTYRPEPTYAPPVPTYAAPAPTYAAPTYAPPAPTYAAPAPTYAAPTYAAPTYSAPTYAPAPSYKAQPSYKPIAILEEKNVHPGDGSYNFHFSTENGIYRSESGVPLPGYSKNAYGQPEGSYRQEGSWSYTDGYGNPIKVTFVADDNGYQPSSDILPTPVPTQYPTPAVDSAYVEPQSAYVESQPAYGKPQPAYQPAYVEPQPAYN